MIFFVSRFMDCTVYKTARERDAPYFVSIKPDTWLLISCLFSSTERMGVGGGNQLRHLHRIGHN
jgi:hypothetical protein